jgi:hypothetical protein
LARDRDGLKAGDIIRQVKIPLLPDVDVYQTLIDTLKERGYAEGDWKNPKATDVFYVFPYDWRRDNGSEEPGAIQLELSAFLSGLASAQAAFRPVV